MKRYLFLILPALGAVAFGIYAAQVPVTPFPVSDGSVTVIPNACGGQIMQSIAANGTITCTSVAGASLPLTYSYNPALSNNTQTQATNIAAAPTVASGGTGSSYQNWYGTIAISLNGSANVNHVFDGVDRLSFGGDGTGACGECFSRYLSLDTSANMTSGSYGAGLIFLEGIVANGTLDKYQPIHNVQSSGSGTITNTAVFSSELAGSNQTNFAVLYCCGQNFASSGKYVVYTNSYPSFFGGGVRMTLTTPASSSAACTQGDFEYDASFVYVCTSTNTWKRATLAAF